MIATLVTPQNLGGEKGKKKEKIIGYTGWKVLLFFKFSKYV
jgi:hypothetical protein